MAIHRARLYQRVEEHARRLEARVAERTAELEAAHAATSRALQALRERAAELQRHNEELDAFAHTVAHDLQSPLATLAGYVDLLYGEERLPAAEREQILLAIRHNARKMSNIVDELLLLAGMRKEKVAVRPITDMGALVAEALLRLEQMVESSGAEIGWPAQWPVALGHPPWVEEIWANYLSNAIKYGGRPPRVEVGARPLPDGFVRFWVRDNGTGLAPEEQARLFTPFTRLHQLRTTGHGLGLSIVRRIVDQIGGRAGVESEVGEGSVFYFDLPTAGRE